MIQAFNITPGLNRIFLVTMRTRPNFKINTRFYWDNAVLYFYDRCEHKIFPFAFLDSTVSNIIDIELKFQTVLVKIEFEVGCAP